ncbi:MAG: formylglycine-generating enzyme family protein, partial [Myxococcales bacterium]|nr:formylglycine-generating enzyme family protein [Myxococcales bacterium]
MGFCLFHARRRPSPRISRSLRLWALPFLGPAMLLAAPAPSAAVTIDWVEIGNPGNPPDTASNCYAADCGSVAYTYYISKYEVTNAQYTEFLNAKAAADPLGLYSIHMGSSSDWGGITRSGVSGSYTYTAKSGYESRPVAFVSFYDALRFTNWL